MLNGNSSLVYGQIYSIPSRRGVLELDTTNQSIDLGRVLQYIANGDADGFVRDAIHRARQMNVICCQYMTLLPSSA